ncbi:MAG: phosphatase PAP2 family protein [Thermoanaerobaculales bacterium]|nr:phosphatase PAP2 family protein [Thermoanaerobaculales bacterium]
MCPVVAFLLTSLGALVLATFLDRPVWQALLHIDPAVQSAEWSLVLRSLGFLPVWLVVALAFYLIDDTTRFTASSRALLLATSVVAAGGLGEVLKGLIRRVRPDATGGVYVWRPFIDDPFSTSGLGMPSGHAMVAFTAAWVLCRLFPRAAGVWICAACGCAVTRVVSQAHFVSDTVLAAVIAFAVVRFIWGCSLYLQNLQIRIPHKEIPSLE